MSEEYDRKGEEREYEGEGPNLRYDDFVGRIVQDPNEPPCVTLLSGYLGSSSEEGHVRLYLDEELCRYVEIPEKAIRHTQEMAPEQSPLGGSLVWIDHDAEVLHGPAGSERRKATFLEGQIAQDYIGGAGGPYYASGGMTTQTRECLVAGGVGGGIVSRVAICPPQPTQQVYCRTLTGILCTRFGPGCRRTLFEPVCTNVGPNCRTQVFYQCQSVYYRCFTQHESYCQESGFVPCNPPFDFTIWQEQFGPHMAFEAGGGGGAQAFAGGFASPTVFCPPTRTLSCQSRFVAACLTRFPDPCQFETAVRCVSRVIRCPTISEPRCRISAVVFCPDTRICEADSAFCGINPGAGRFDPAGGAFAQGFDAMQFEGGTTQSRDCQTQTVDCHNIPSRAPHCHGGGVGFAAAPQSQVCPSRFTPCQSQFARCPSALDACPTRYNCPSLPNGCPGHTRFGACETFGPCPSAVDACPSRFGCYESQFCGRSVACGPGGGFDPGGGGFDPGRFGGGGGGGFGGGF